MYILFRRQYKIKYDYIYIYIYIVKFHSRNTYNIYINRVKYCKYSSNETLYIIYISNPDIYLDD